MAQFGKEDHNPRGFAHLLKSDFSCLLNYSTCCLISTSVPIGKL